MNQINKSKPLTPENTSFKLKHVQQVEQKPLSRAESKETDLIKSETGNKEFVKLQLDNNNMLNRLSLQDDQTNFSNPNDNNL